MPKVIYRLILHLRLNSIDGKKRLTYKTTIVYKPNNDRKALKFSKDPFILSLEILPTKFRYLNEL
jgi:hypothetical protein